MIEIIEEENFQDDFGSLFIDIPLGRSKPRVVIDESQLDAYYYDKVVSNSEQKMKVPD